MLINSGGSRCVCNQEWNWGFSLLLRLEGWGSSWVWAALGQTPPLTVLDLLPFRFLVALGKTVSLAFSGL